VYSDDGELLMVLHVILASDVSYPFISGVTRVSWTLFKELQKYKNVKVHFVIPSEKKIEKKILYKRGYGGHEILSINPLKLYKLYDNVTYPNPLYTYIGAKKLLNTIINDEKYVIHAHSPYVTFYMLRFASRKVNIPFVLTVHTRTWDWIKDRLGDNYISRAMIGLDILSIRASLRKAKLITTPSTHTKRLLIRRFERLYPGLRDKTVTIPNPLERKMFLKPKRKVSDIYDNIMEKEYALWVGRISHEKNVHFLVEVFRKLPYKLVLVGEGPLLNYIKSKNYGNIIPVGKVPDSVLRVLMHDARIFVSASTWETQFLSMLETMAQGVPAVIPLEGGQADFVRDYYNGFKYKNFKQMKEFVNILFRDDDIYQAMSNNALKVAMTLHPDNIVPKFLKLYEIAVSYAK